MTYVADVTALPLEPGRAAIACSVCVELTGIGPEYCGDEVVGALSSVV
jgi:hypothetical protein